MKPILKDYTEFKLFVQDKHDSKYEFHLLFKDERFFLKINQQNFYQLQWKTSFSFESLTAENKKWYFFEDNYHIYEQILTSINEKNYKFEKMDEFCLFNLIS